MVLNILSEIWYICGSLLHLRFLSMLEEEVYSHNSPIWSQDFLAGVSGGQIPVHTGNTSSQMSP